MGAGPPRGLSQGLREMVTGGDIWICRGLRAPESVENPRGSQPLPLLPGCMVPRPLEGAKPECVPSCHGQQTHFLVWDRVGGPVAGRG